MKPLFLLAIGLVSRSLAESVTLSPSQDGDVYSYLDQPTSSVYTLNVSASGVGAPHSNRSLIQFNLTSLTIPPSEIGSAVLRLYTYPPEIGTTGLGNVALYRQGNAWTASILRWNQIQPQELVRILPVTQLNTWVEADLTALVKQWATGAVPNHGVVLMPESETSGLNLTFLSADMPTATYRPQLVITRQAVPPTLTIRNQGSFVLLEWPVTTSSGWTLQEAPSPAGPWTATTAVPANLNGKWTLTHPPSGSRFFRLRKP